MTDTRHQMLREIVEGIHEDMMRSLVDAPPPERAVVHEPLESRLSAAGFDDSPSTAASFRGACVRMLAADLDDDAVVEIVEACRRSAAPGAAIRNLERYLESTTNPSVFLRTMLAAPPMLHLLSTVFGVSQHMADILVRQPGFLYWLMEQRTWDAPDTVESFETWLAEEADRFLTVEGKLNSVRRTHRQALLKIGVLDMVSGAPIEEVTRRLSELADACARTVLEIAFDELTADDTFPRALAVIALGKLGGIELNYSSDIDLLFVSENTDDETMHHYTKVARRFTDAMSTLTDEGYLYRVDLRLRPDGKAGPLVNSEDSLLIYYQNRGRPWEFQALLKARVIAGDFALGTRVLDTLAKLVYSTTLPYSPLEAVGAMRDQIKDHVPIHQRGHNIKLMSGGIRDVEFVAQAMQLMHASAHPELRTPTTLVALSRLRQLDLLKEWDVDNLAAAYRFFRLVEHRLQMMHQLQTHTLPASDAEIALLAQRVSNGPLGSFTADSFVETLSKHLNHVRTFADSFFAGEAVHPHSVLLMLPEESERAVSILSPYGITDVGRAMRTLHTMAYGSFPRLLDRQARASFEALLPHLLADAAATGDPDLTIVNLAQIAAAEKGEAAFYRMLADSAPARGLVVGLAGMSSMITRELCAQIGVLDPLVEGSAEPASAIEEMLHEVPEWERMSARDAVARSGTAAAVERQARERQWFERLRIHTLAACLRSRFARGRHGATGEVARARSARLHVAAAFDELVPERDRVAVFAMGSYGVGEPRITSDLDLLVVAEGVELSDLMQRVQIINQWFTDGRILKLDFRLRAEGASAPLVQDLAFYDSYFRERASLWERVAFAKCTAWWGGEDIKRAFARKLRAFVARPVARDEIASLLDLRRAVEGLAPRQFVEWDTKRSAGGRYDVEYLLAVGMAATCADRLDYFTLSTHERIEALIVSGFLSADEGAALRRAIDLFMRVEHFMEIQEMTHPGSEEKAAYLSHYLDRTMESLIGVNSVAHHLAECKKTVRSIYETCLRA